MKTNFKMVMPVMAVMTSILLNACAGTEETTVAEGGISGTGITMGRITEFGSIYVNGVKFDVDGATFTRDGGTSTGQEEFSIGEYVVIKGQVNDAATLGTADEVDFEDILEGAVTVASTDDETIEILGQLIKTNTITEFHDFTNLTDLVAGNIVEVSGIKDASGLVTATSIKLKEESFVDGESENELKGTVSDLKETEETFMIGNILVDYSSASFDGFSEEDLQDGLFVEAKSDSAIVGTTLVATEIELENEYQEVTTNTELEIEGVVTRFVSITDFDVNGIPVTTNDETEFKEGVAADLGLNTPVEVDGKINESGVLVAEEVEFEEE